METKHAPAQAAETSALDAALDPGPPAMLTTPRQDLNNRSLPSLRAISRPPPIFTPSSEREGKFEMNFGQTWRSDNCPVEQWYQTQVTLAAQEGSSTRFSAIQYRRIIDSRYHHEFLVFLLANGSFYRVDRSGGGSHVDAVRGGCKAYDSIQWVPADRLAAVAEIAELKFEVRFPTELDILEVLAICFAVQHNSNTVRYTLGCFNCYFMCYTILSVLTRRYVAWESAFSEDQWLPFLRTCVQRMGNDIMHKGSSEMRYSFLRACRAFRPNDSQPAQSLLESIGKDLDGTFGSFKSFQKLLIRVSWWWDARPSLGQYPDGQGSGFPAQQTLSTLGQAVCGTGAYDHDSKSINTISNWRYIRLLVLSPSAYGRKQLVYHTKLSADSLNPHAEDQTHRPEDFPRRQMANALCKPAFVAYLFAWSILQDPVFKELQLSGHSSFTAFGLRTAPKYIQSQIFFDYQHTGSITKAKLSNDAKHLGFIEDVIMNNIVDKPPGREFDRSEEASLWRALGTNSSQRCWLHSIREFIFDELLSSAQFQITQDRPALQVLMGGKDAVSTTVDIFKFQNLLIEQIKRNTRRMDRRGIGFVVAEIDDMIEAISDIWRSTHELKC
ncbi:hypothetical protein RhiLY_10094 [Ceratobasidium sp. AG-Ba]|nr:hypothetical protein RhiLY_10094 [Ceratobasidium sp. AG-Ba]